MNGLADTLRPMFERLLAGEMVRIHKGKRARRTSEPTTCTGCAGKGKCLPDPRAWDVETCDACYGLGKVFEHVIEDDPTVLQPWTGAEFTAGGGFAERHRADGERVAYVENDQGGISIGIEPVGGRDYTIHLSAQYDDNLVVGRAVAEDEALTWAIALRLADAELAALGYRNT